MIGWGTLFRNALTIMPGTFNSEDSILYDGELSEVVQLTNAAKAYLYGVSATWADITSLAFLHFQPLPTPTDGWKPILHHIRWIIFHLSLVAQDVRLQLDKFRCDAYIMYQGWKRIEDYNIVGGEDNEQVCHTLWDARMVHPKPESRIRNQRKLTLQAGIDNITDQHLPGVCIRCKCPGRNLYLTVRASI